MNDGDTSPKINLNSDISQCVSCRRVIKADELFGYNGMCTQCCEDNGGEHHGG